MVTSFISGVVVCCYEYYIDSQVYCSFLFLFYLLDTLEHCIYYFAFEVAFLLL